jgi:hypothetical protein
MNPSGSSSARLALATGVLAVLAWPCAHAQEADAAAQEPPYRDRIIAPSQLQALPPDEDDEDDLDGPPRGFHAEAIASRTERGDDSYDEQGISIGGFRETANWGTFSLEATLFDSNRDRFDGIGDGGLGGLATLWQRDFWINGRWRLDNGLGVLNTPATPLQRNQYRFFLPTVAFAGASSEWHDDADGLLLQGAAGRAGIYTGTRIVGFDIADGDVAALNAQWRWAPGWTGAASFLGTQGRIVPDGRGEAVFETGDTGALYAATAWQGDRDSVQFNLLSSHASPASATGAWIDASARRGRYAHNYGAFHLGEGLAWGAYPISNDAQGGYYRINYQYARWSWNAGLDAIDSISGKGFDGLYASSFARYQASAALGYGGSLNLRHGAGDTGYSAQAFVDHRGDWGQTRWQFDTAHGNGNDSWQFGIDQAFPLREGNRLSASLSYGSLDYGFGPSRTTTLALYGGRDLGDRVSVDGSAHWTQGNGEGAIRGTDFNIGVNVEVTRRWLLTAAFYQSLGSQRSPFVIDPLVTEQPFVSLPRDRSVFLTLRYERNAGRPQGMLGGMAADGPAGSVAGSVFLDENADGVRSASELPAQNVTVLLDGRYAVRTDSLGNFAFPRVSAGSHALAVVPDNLPLPWSLRDGDAERRIEVEVRQATAVDFGARRQP